MSSYLPDNFILFDTEFTAWEGSLEGSWKKEGEHREIVQIGAIQVRRDTLVVENSFALFIQPIINPQLSEYFIKLTGITQQNVDTMGVTFKEAVSRFFKWCDDKEIYSFGKDGDVIEENCRLASLTNPFRNDQFHNIREYFETFGIEANSYHSSDIVEAFGLTSNRTAHNALNDTLTILDGLRAIQKGLPVVEPERKK